MKYILTAVLLAAFAIPVHAQGDASGAKKPLFGIAPPPRTAQAHPKPPRAAPPRPAPKKLETKTYGFKESTTPSGRKPGMK